MPVFGLYYDDRPDPKWSKAMRAWESYYFARGVAVGRCWELARKKCRKSNRMPPNG